MQAKNIMKKIIILAALFFCSAALHAQTSTDNELSKSFPFKDSTVDHKMYFTVKEGMANISILFKVTLTKGRLSFHVTDPEGKKVGNFNLDKGSKGEFSSNESSPLPGKWVLYITLSNATGNLSYDVKIDEN